MTTTPTPPAAPMPAAPAQQQPVAAQDAEPKRQRFTLTRARDLDARLDAILLRSRTALTELAEVGIAEGVEEQNPVRAQLAQILPLITTAYAQVEQAKEKSAQIVTLLDL